MGHCLIIDNDKQGAEFWDTYFTERGSIGGMYDYMQKNIYPNLTWQERRMHFRDITIKLEAIRVAQIRDKFTKGDFDTLRNMTQKSLCRMIDDINLNLGKRNYKGDMKSLVRVEQLEQFETLHQTDHLERLQNLERIERIERIERMNLSYDAVPIQSKPSETILYCDIPYANSSNYKAQKSGDFNHEAFYQWCIDKAKEGYNVFISEYAMPEDRFKCVYDINVKCTMGGATKQSSRTEKLFVPIV